MSDGIAYPLRKPGEPPALVEMIFLCNDEAERIENVEAARAALGEKPIPERVRRAEIFRATANYLTRIEHHKEQVNAILARKGGRR